jgi:hypothetical protein
VVGSVGKFRWSKGGMGSEGPIAGNVDFGAPVQSTGALNDASYGGAIENDRSAAQEFQCLFQAPVDAGEDRRVPQCIEPSLGFAEVHQQIDEILRFIRLERQ